MRNINFLKNETESISTKMTLKNSQKLLVGLLALVMVAGMTSPAFAQTAENTPDASRVNPDEISPLAAVSTDGTYYGTFWSGVEEIQGSAFDSFPGAVSPWTFNCGADTCWLTVLDGFIPIDQFEVFDFGQSIGNTSTPNLDGVSCGADPEACIADPDFSRGLFCLGPGEHSITIDQTLNPSLGAGWFKVEIHDAEDECNTPIGGTSIPVSTTSLLVAGAQANMGLLSLALVGMVGVGAAITYKLKSKKTEQ